MKTAILTALALGSMELIAAWQSIAIIRAKMKEDRANGAIVGDPPD